MDCDFVDCSNLLIKSQGVIGVIENDPPSALYIRYLFKDDERPLRWPCPSHSEIICCNLVEIKDQGLCGFDKVLGVVEVSKELTRSTTVPATVLPTLTVTSTTYSESTSRTNGIHVSSRNSEMRHTGNRSDALLLSACFMLGFVSLLFVVFLVRCVSLKMQRSRSWRLQRSSAADRRNRKARMVTRKQRKLPRRDSENGHASSLV